MFDLTVPAIALLAVGALLVGVTKTALPGASTLAVAMYAAVLPAKESTGTLLLLLMVGDAMALLIYRRQADWRALVALAPAVLAGIAAGALFLWFADDSGVRRTIGVILLALIALTLWLRRRGSAEAIAKRHGRAMSWGYGSLGGFTTMVANAGGPVMSMYFLARGFSVKAFLGTSAWFFAIINAVKVPIAGSLGLITSQTLVLDAMLAPVVIVGGVIGWFIAGRIPQRTFEIAVLVLTVLGAAYLLV